MRELLQKHEVNIANVEAAGLVQVLSCLVLSKCHRQRFSVHLGWI